MYRQLYMGGGIGSLDAGAPSIKYTGNINSQMASAPDPMDALNDLAMQLFGKPLDMLTPDERQALDEYNSGMMAVGGRVNYGIGSKLKKFAKNVIDPIAQVAAFIPGVHQPFAQGYTALRSSGVGGDNYGGLKVLGVTPGAGQLQPYGTYGMPRQGGFNINDFVSNVVFTGTEGPVLTSGGQLNKPYGIPKTSVTEKIAEATKRYVDIINDPNNPGRNQAPKGILNTIEDAFKGPIGKVLKDVVYGNQPGREGEKLVPTIAAATLAKLSYDQQKALEERLKREYEAYQAGVSRFRERTGDKSKLKGYEVVGVPRTARDVVRAPVMGGV